MSARLYGIWRSRANEAEARGHLVMLQPTQLRGLLDLLEDAEQRAETAPFPGVTTVT